MSSRSVLLIQHLASLSEGNLAPEVMQASTTALLDAIGCGLYGSQQLWGKIAEDFVLSERSHGRASLYGCGNLVAPARAALANGTSTHGFEFDDMILSAQGHPGAVVIPSALAAAQQAGASGPRLLLAIAAGYEMFARLGRAFTENYSSRGFHVTGITGTVASTIAAGVAMRLETAQLLSAVGIACSSASGIKAFIQGNGGMVKRWHAGHAAESGIVACEMARRGFTGPTEAIDGRFGLLQVIGGPTAQPELLDKDLDAPFAITSDIWVKVYPCCGVLHSTLHALESIKERHALSAEQVAKMVVHTNRRAVAQNGNLDPQETMAAQYSLPYAAAVAVAKDPRDPDAYAEGNLHDPVVRGILARTELAVDEDIDRLFPLHMGARVELSLTNGEQLQATILDPHGSAGDPCTPAFIETKFRGLAGRTKSPDTVQRIFEAAVNLPASASLDALSCALREKHHAQ